MVGAALIEPAQGLRLFWIVTGVFQGAVFPALLFTGAGGTTFSSVLAVAPACCVAILFWKVI